jgi:hypothetical protein
VLTRYKGCPGKEGNFARRNILLIFKKMENLCVCYLTLCPIAEWTIVVNAPGIQLAMAWNRKSMLMLRLG